MNLLNYKNMNIIFQYKYFLKESKYCRNYNPDKFIFNNKKWRLYLQIDIEDNSSNISDEVYTKYISLTLHCIDPPAICMFEIYLQKFYGEGQNNIIKSIKYDNVLFSKKTQKIEIKKIIEKEELLKKVEDNEFIIFGINMDKYINFSHEDLLNCKYFNNILDELKDIKIKVENKEINTSKYILCMNSPYFKTMLKSNMMENNIKNPVIEYKDFEYYPLINVLYYIYTKKIIYCDNEEMLIENFFKMYKIADYFQIKELTFKIESFLINKISINNFSKIYIFSDKNETAKLKNCVIDYICINSKDIINTENFNEIINISEKETICDLMKKIILSKN